MNPKHISYMLIMSWGKCNARLIEAEAATVENEQPAAAVLTGLY